MKQNHILSLLQENYTTVAVTFAVEIEKYLPGVNKLYTYKTNVDLKENDMVVVPSPDGFRVVRIIEVHDSPEIDTDASFDYKWVVDKVDMEGYEEILKAEEIAAKELRNVQANAVRRQAKELLKETIGTDLPKLEVPKRRL